MDGRQRVWRLYGWFSGLMLFGSCIGTVTWLARMQDLVDSLNGNFLDDISVALRSKMFASTSRWRAAFSVMYAGEFMCLSLAELMVLERMSDFAISHIVIRSRRWMFVGRGVLGAVVAGNLVGLASATSAAARWGHAAVLRDTAYREFSANNTVYALALSADARSENQIAFSIASVQSFSEVTMLLLIVVSFVIVGVACARRVSATLHGISAPTAAAALVATMAGKKLHRQIVATTAFVGAGFLLRSVYSTMYAVANELQDSGNICPNSLPRSLCDSACFNVYTHMGRWMTLTPEFQIIVVFISSPLALLVALWGMTPKHTLRQMRLSRMASVSRSREPLRPSSVAVGGGSSSGGVSMQDSLLASAGYARVQRPGEI